MNATTVAVDLAKSVFPLAIADERWRVLRRERPTRMQLLYQSHGELRHHGSVRLADITGALAT